MGLILIFAVFADATASANIFNAHERAPTVMEPRNLFNENFVDRYPRYLSPTKFKSYTVIAQVSCIL